MIHAYINPTLTKFETIEEILTPKEPNIFDREYNTKIQFDFSGFFSNNKAWILGEPGCGKSTLLKQIVSDSKNNNKKAIVIPVSKIKNKTIEEYITNTTIQTDPPDIFKEESFKTSDFVLENKEDVIVCLDALDEVSGADFPNVIQEIKNFSNQYDKAVIYVSCRAHYIKKSVPRFKQFKEFSCIVINNFNQRQIEEYLKENIPAGTRQDEIISALIQKSQTNKGHSILSIPRYLEVQVKILQNSSKTPQEIIKMKRIDFFEQFVYKKLETEIESGNESSNVKQNEKIITKRVLEKLALIMEIYQVNQITRDELMTFLDDTDSNANLIFLNHCDIDLFIDRVLKHFDDVIEFDNTEFQEYLAAKELLRLGQKNQILYDLIIEPQLKHIYKNWYDVLRYVIEIDAKQIMPLIDFLSQKGEFIIEDDYFTLISTLDEEQLDSSDKERIFKVIFEYYQKAHLNLWHEQAKKLSIFYQPNNCNLIEREIEIKEKDDSRLLANQIVAVEHLIDTDKLNINLKTYWENILKTHAQNDKYPEIQTRSLLALQKLNKISIFKDIISIFKNSLDKKVFEIFVSCCSKIAPDDTWSIDIFCEDIKKGREQGKIAIGHISNPISLKYLLDKFIADHDLLEKYANKNRNFSFIDFTLFIKNLKDNWDDEISQKLKEVFTTIITSSHINIYNVDAFFTDLIFLFNSKTPDYIYELNKSVPEDFRFHKFEKILCEIIKLDHVKKFIEDCKSLKYGEFTVISVFGYIRHSKNPQKEEIFEEGRKYLSEMYDRWEKQKREEKTEDEKNWDIYQKFRHQLNFVPGGFHRDLFSTFFAYKEIIYARASKVEIKRLKILLRKISELNDPQNCVITITETSPTSRSLNINNSHFFNFGFYLKVALELNLKEELKKYRRHFVQIIPIVDAHEQIGMLLEYLGDFTDQDIDDLLFMYENRSDDLLINSPISTIEAVSKIRSNVFVPVLKNFIDNPKLRQHEKEKSLECLGSIFPDEGYLQSKFDTFINGDENSKCLAEIANEYLVRKFKNKKAIEWRFNEIKNRIKPFIRKYNEGFTGYSNWEEEIDRPSFLNCVIDLMDTSLIPQFHNLLIFSFDVRKDIQYLEYSNYIQRNVYAYYLSLRNVGTYSYIKQLKSLITDNLESKSFKFHLRNLEIQYIEEINKPRNISDCVKKYNELKAKQYQSIHNSLELFHIVDEIINEDIEVFIQKEGFFKPMQKLVNGIGIKSHVDEDTVQKILKIQIENGLLKRGFRSSDIHREVELYDGKRLDLLISYGFVGPIMIEVKLLHNDEILKIKERGPYKDKIKKYLTGTHAEYGFYLVLKVKDNPKHDIEFDNLCIEYSDIKNLHVKIKNCC